MLTASTGLRQLGANALLCLRDVAVFLLSTAEREDEATERIDDLAPDEKAYMERLASPDHRRRFIFSRTLLRTALSMLEDEDVPASRWHFGTGSNGKPFIKAPQGSITSFNLSYTDPYIALAVTKAGEIGVDIERVRPFPEDELPWHLFSDGEQALLRATSPQDFWSVFFRLWTLKEAIAKRMGTGFSTEFHEIDTLALAIGEGFEGLDEKSADHPLLLHARLTLFKEPLHIALSLTP